MRGDKQTKSRLWAGTAWLAGSLVRMLTLWQCWAITRLLCALAFSLVSKNDNLIFFKSLKVVRMKRVVIPDALRTKPGTYIAHKISGAQ